MLRPQDIVILLKIISLKDKIWMNKDLARDLYLSPAEVSNSLQRSAMSGLLNLNSRKVKAGAFIDFLVHGLPYVFFQIPQGTAKGMPTGHSHEYFNDKMGAGGEVYVWPDAESNSRGQSIQPLYPGAVAAAKKDPQLYLLLALTDVLRIGKVREKEIAINKLKEELYESSR